MISRQEEREEHNEKRRQEAGTPAPKNPDEFKVKAWELPLLSYNIYIGGNVKKTVKCHMVSISKDNSLFTFFVNKEFIKGSSTINQRHNMRPSQIISNGWFYDAVLYVKLVPGDYVEQVPEKKEKP